MVTITKETLQTDLSAKELSQLVHSLKGHSGKLRRKAKFMVRKAFRLQLLQDKVNRLADRIAQDKELLGDAVYKGWEEVDIQEAARKAGVRWIGEVVG